MEHLVWSPDELTVTGWVWLRGLDMRSPDRHRVAGRRRGAASAAGPAGAPARGGRVEPAVVRLARRGRLRGHRRPRGAAAARPPLLGAGRAGGAGRAAPPRAACTTGSPARPRPGRRPATGVAARWDATTGLDLDVRSDAAAAPATASARCALEGSTLVVTIGGDGRRLPSCPPPGRRCRRGSSALPAASPGWRSTWTSPAWPHRAGPMRWSWAAARSRSAVRTPAPPRTGSHGDVGARRGGPAARRPGRVRAGSAAARRRGRPGEPPPAGAALPRGGRAGHRDGPARQRRRPQRVRRPARHRPLARRAPARRTPGVGGGRLLRRGPGGRLGGAARQPGVVRRPGRRAARLPRRGPRPLGLPARRASGCSGPSRPTRSSRSGSGSGGARG